MIHTLGDTTTAMNQNLSSKDLILEVTEPLRDALDDRVYWQWDKHHEALLAEFSVDHENIVKLTVKQHFPFIWDNKSLKKASPLLRHRAQSFSELSKKQLLMTRDQTGDDEIMLAWWPWGHGATISMRIFRGDPSDYIPPTGLVDWFKALISRH